MLPINKLNPFRRFCMTIGELPTSYIESMTYAELVTWLCNYLENTVIPTVNNNGEAVTELQNLFKELETFVTTYLDSPKFLEDVNNKLDEMAEDGTFDQIINTNITGSLSNLETTTHSNLVSAINEVNGNVGDLENLNTPIKTNVVNAINSLNTYSSDEMIVGTWINESPIYRKVIDTGNLTDLTRYNEHDDIEIKNVITGNITPIKMECFGGNGSYWWDFSNHTLETNNTLNFINVTFVTGATNDLVISSIGNNKPLYETSSYVILYYIKNE